MIIMALHAAVVERDDDLLRSFWGVTCSSNFDGGSAPAECERRKNRK